MADVFVFASNLAGRHGAGSAKHARQYFGAIYGTGVGRQGKSYAIPTKDTKLHTLPLETIQRFVEEFLLYAKENFWESFNVVEIGCGLAGYKPEEIAPMFKDVPENVNIPNSFKEINANRN